MKTNSQILLSDKLYFGDIDGDGLDELIEVNGRHVDVFKANADHTPVVSMAFPAPVKRLIIGDFVSSGRERGKDQILGILADGSVRGYAISNNKSEMWWWFTQPSFVKSNQHYVVGDFDGDGADEVLVYTPSSGSITIWEKKPKGVMGKMTGWSLGNLAKHPRKRKLLIAGNFGQASNRDDLLVIDRGAGQIARFDTATDKKGVKTFWWAYTSKPKQFGSKDDILVANIDGGTKDGILIRSYGTGKYRLCKAEYGNKGKLVGVGGALTGQLPVKARNGKIVAAKVRNKAFRRERGGARRDDILYFNSKNLEFIRTDARFDKKRNRYTYWWAYTSNLVVEPQVKPLKRPWAVILCKFKDTGPDAKVEKMFRDMFEPGSGGMIEYWHDVSLGAVDVGGSKVIGWVTVDMKRKDAAGKGREKLINAAVAAAKKAGQDPTKGFHKQIAVFCHDFSKPGAPSGVNWSDPVWGPFWIDGSADRFGRVSAPPHGHNGSFIAHEMGHGMSFDHDLKKNLSSHYGDPNCIMSAMAVRWFRHQHKKAWGPAMSAPQLDIKGWLYKRRIYKPSKNWVKGAGLTFELAPIDDRRQNAHLAVILPANASNSWRYELEYMRPVGWNEGLVKPRLVVRRRVGKTAAFLGEVIVADKRGHKRSWIEPSGDVRFEVEKIRNDDRRVRVRVKKV